MVLAGHGLKGLTHRGIDRQAGLPEGSSSAYFRSRAALQQAVAEHVSDRLVQDVADLSDTLAAGDHSVAQAVLETGALSAAGSPTPSWCWPVSSSPSPRPATTSWRWR